MTSSSILSAEQFIDYRFSLERSLKDKHVPENRILRILAYTDTLHNNEVPLIFDQPHLSALLGYDLDYVQVLSSCQSDFYIEYRIPKKNGKLRVIHEPLPNLKEIQTWILNNILLSPGAQKMVAPVAMAFLPHRSIKDNARVHAVKRSVICMDLKDFFSSVQFIQVYLLFNKMGYGRDVAGMLANLCTLNGVLPQGAPTSPMISNLILSEADKELTQYCDELGVHYTRYADDLTFSTNHMIDYGQLIGRVKIIMGKNKLSVNNEKTKVYHRNQSQIVTGIVVNDYLQVPKAYRKRIRQEVYYLKRFGLMEHHSRCGFPISPELYLQHLYGKINHALNINADDGEMREYKRLIKEMMTSFLSPNLL